MAAGTEAEGMLRMIDRNAVQQMLGAGVRIGEVARHFKVSRRTIERIRKEPRVESGDDAAARRARRVGRPGGAGGGPGANGCADRRGPAGPAARGAARASRGGAQAGREHVLPAVPGGARGPAPGADGALRGRSRGVRAVRLRSGGRAAPGRAQAARALRRVSAQALALGFGGAGAGRAGGVSDPGIAGFVRGVGRRAAQGGVRPAQDGFGGPGRAPSADLESDAGADGHRLRVHDRAVRAQEPGAPGAYARAAPPIVLSYRILGEPLGVARELLDEGVGVRWT